MFDELCLHLDANTRYTYDYSTSRLLIYGLHTYYHEIGTPILGALSRSFDSQLGPQINRYMALANLASNIDWHGGGPSVRMVNKKGDKKTEKVPDASIGMSDRRFPTVVVEVGKSQPLLSLRAAGTLWFAHELEVPGTIGQELHVRNPERSPGVELVILIDFAKEAQTQGEGGGDEEEHAGASSSVDEDTNAAAPPEGGHTHAEPLGRDFTHVYLELWRCCNTPSCRSAPRTQGIETLPPHRQTRGSTASTRPNPHMCQRLQIYPPLVSGEQENAIFYLTDFVGSDSFDDPSGRMHMGVPVQVFAKCVETITGKLLSVGQGRKGVIRMDDLEEERLGLEQSMPAAPHGSVGKENIARLGWVLVEKVNLLGEEIVGGRRKAVNVRMEAGMGGGGEVEQDWAGNRAVKRVRRV